MNFEKDNIFGTIGTKTPNIAFHNKNYWNAKKTSQHPQNVHCTLFVFGNVCKENAMIKNEMTNSQISLTYSQTQSPKTNVLTNVPNL